MRKDYSFEVSSDDGSVRVGSFLNADDIELIQLTVNVNGENVLFTFDEFQEFIDLSTELLLKVTGKPAPKQTPPQAKG